MKTISSLAAGAALSALVATGALASDLNGGSLKDGGGTFTPAHVNWTGFYIGGRLGYGHANHDLTVEAYQNGAEAVEAVPASCTDHKGETWNGTESDCEAGHFTPAVLPLSAIEGFTEELFGLNGLDSSGVTGGGQLGFDLQRGRFVFGLFGSYDFSAMETTVSMGGTEIKAIEKGDEWSVGARAGLLVNPRTLAYILAAYTESDFDFAGLGEDGGSKEITFSGITVGGGVEFALTQNVFLGIEGTHTFYGEETLFDINNGDDVERGASGIRGKDEIGVTKVMGTLKIKLNGGDVGLGN